jgi:hypothetical protein
MNKKEIQARVLQNGKPLSLDKFEWDEKSNVFSTTEDNLVLDFKFIEGITFKTGSDCTFDTGFSCTFNTGSCCSFNTGYDCSFKTVYGCTFKTGSECVVVRRDVFEVIEILESKKLKLNPAFV